MDLFLAAQGQHHHLTPLAERLRPQNLSEFMGQESVIGPHGLIQRYLDQKKLPSLILWGPPGTGKTTLALILARLVNAIVEHRNAIDLGSKEIRELGQKAQEQKLRYQQVTVVFVDEIHRLNKSQQDSFLPFVEKGDFVLIGATTETPSYELNAALLSRCQVIRLDLLKKEDLKKILMRAAQMTHVSLADVLSDEAQEFLIQWAAGDARVLLNGFELCLGIFIHPVLQKNYQWPISAKFLNQILAQTRPLYYDKKADYHYDTISAFIKSIRGSDADASLYYLARMIKAGEDPRFIARRLIILASEDIGNADPRALTLAVAAFQAVEAVGMPEAAINLAHVVTYLATAPKSNRSYLGIKKALAEVDFSGALPIPFSLRNPNAHGLKELGYGKEYAYSHEGEKGWIAQDFLPSEIKGKKFYEPTDRGYEKTIQQFLHWLKS